ncbi:hypothetical protein SAMN05660649_04741 [Desulfotomaculum arcticum]|uniref:Holin of 3TMs, for gene-transfer release n=1 Tax=Desulfotruncus arcticus DSM 17038 TaxID=1121424 RepID=A0A1I2Z3F1_9FIRM|nr:hypothetical protein [Desulfotruncus arcticus]SFH32230.1 hypothetical protein SAMN05660649_04741 [Desulfotomaculum arcticum] [Desulfotruncus arcticus DSM 17038]
MVNALLDKWFHPNRAKQQELQDRIKELQELSNLALEIGNRQIYKNLQVESNELLMKYLTYAFFDGLRFLAPHLFILAIISTKISSIHLPVSIPALGDKLSIVFPYIVVAVLANYLYKKYKRKRDCLPV